ncbi:MAG TPA: hypothetical protein VFW87_01380 [Pirellulales bacterium]|nr:hypothetical protein [Pirellulales bacterium]
MFDPYRKWLGIPEDQRPPNHYQLLGIAPDEQDREVIEAAAVRQSAFVRNFQSGKYGTEATRLLTEIAAARLCLLDPGKRASYDAELKQRIGPQRIGPQRRSAQPTAPRRAADRGSEPDLGFAPLEDKRDLPADSAEPSAPMAAPESQRPAPSSSKTPSQSSARHRDLAPPVSPPASRAPAHRTPAPASMPPPVNLDRLLPQPASSRARPSRLGRPRPTSYAKPSNPIGLLWQIPLVLVVFIGLVLIANALGRKIAASRPPAEPVPAASITS